MKKKRTGIKLDPDYLVKQKAALVRKNRQVVLFNDSEMAAINAYCTRFKVHSKASALREIIMKAVLGELEDNHPTLF